MKIQLIKSALVAAAIGLLATADRAHAVATLGFDQNDDGIIDFIISDGAAAPTVYNTGQPAIPATTSGDNSPVNGQVNAIISTVGGVFAINTGVTKPQLGSATSPVMAISLNVTGVPPGTYDLYFSDTSFGPSSSAFLADLTFNPAPDSTSPTINYSTYASASNTLFQPFGSSNVLSIPTSSASLITTQSFSTGTAGADVTAGSVVPASITANPYSLTQKIQIIVPVGSKGNFTATGNLSSAAPDGGATVALLGLALAGIEVIRRKLRVA